MQTANRSQEVKRAIGNSHRLDLALDLLIDYLMREQDGRSEGAAAEHKQQERVENLDAPPGHCAECTAYSASSLPSRRVLGCSNTASKSERRKRRPPPDLSL